MDSNHRPSKKQRELLTYIENFIRTNGYGPSYREIMRSLDYKSVSTVAVHVNGLIKKGHLTKRDNSARSLEVVNVSVAEPTWTKSHEKWLTDKVDHYFDSYRSKPTAQSYDELCILTGALAVLGFESAAIDAKKRLSELQKVKARK